MLDAPYTHLNTRSPDLARRLLRWVVVDVTVLLLAEVVLRVVAPQYANLWSDGEHTMGVPKGDRGYDHGVTVLTSPRGPGEHRVAFFGDSVTFGWGVPVDRTVAAQTADRLTELAPGEWVGVNMAGLGTSPIVARLAIEQDLGAWDLDAVVYQFNLSDLGEDPEGATAEGLAARRARREKAGALPWWALYQRSALFQFLRVETDRVNYLLGARFIDLTQWRSSTYWKELSGRFQTEEVDVAWDRQLDALAGIQALCEARGIPFLVYVLPQQFDLSDRRAHNFWALDTSRFEVDPYARFAEEATERGLHHAVYLEDFQRAAVDTPRLYYANDMSHPTDAGLSVAAQPLARDILEQAGL